MEATTKDSDGSVGSSLSQDESMAATSSRPGHSVKEGEGGGETPTSSTTTALARMQNEISDLRNEHHREVSTLRLGLNNTNQDVSILKRNCKKNTRRLDDIERSRWTEEQDETLQRLVAEKVKEEGIPSDDFTAAHWRSIGKEMESDFHYTSIKKHYNFLISALLEKFSSLSISQRTLAVKKAIMCKSSSVARNWRSKSITLLVADPEGANISSQEMVNGINSISSKLKRAIQTNGDIDVSSLNTLLNVNLNRSDYIRFTRAFELEGAELLLEEEEQDEPHGIGLLPDETTSDNTLLVVDTMATSTAGDDTVSMMTSETTEQAKQQSKKRLTSATSLTSSATTTSLSTHTSPTSLSTKSSSSLEAVAESKMASTLSNDATETDTSLEDKQPTGSLNIESTQLLELDISKSRQQQQELREDEGQSTASTSMLVSYPPEKQIPEEQSDIQRQTVKKTIVPEPLSVLESRLHEKQSNVQKLNEMIDKATVEKDIKKTRFAKMKLKRAKKELEDIKLKCRLHPDAVNSENAPTVKSKSTQMSLPELKDEVKKIQTTLRTCHDFQKRQSLIKKENHLMTLIRKKKNDRNHRKPLGARN